MAEVFDDGYPPRGQRTPEQERILQRWQRANFDLLVASDVEVPKERQRPLKVIAAELDAISEEGRAHDMRLDWRTDGGAYSWFLKWQAEDPSRKGFSYYAWRTVINPNPIVIYADEDEE